jgi:hypothetical protein
LASGFSRTDRRGVGGHRLGGTWRSYREDAQKSLATTKASPSPHQGPAHGFEPDLAHHYSYQYCLYRAPQASPCLVDPHGIRIAALAVSVLPATVPPKQLHLVSFDLHAMSVSPPPGLAVPSLTNPLLVVCSPFASFAITQASSCRCPISLGPLRLPALMRHQRPPATEPLLFAS